MTSLPRSLPAATRMLERYAELKGELGKVEAKRGEGIATVNAFCDEEAAPLLKEMATLKTPLEQWWPGAAPLIANGKKSLELGGCIIGSREGKDTLAHTFKNDDAAAAALAESRFRQQTTRSKVTIDKAAILKLLAIGGKTGAAIAALGFSIKPGVDQFFVKRAEQAVTRKP